ncbi:MAG: hypothetical protein KKC37_02460, partial [Proteobacteria bacterium]|nr:hypothetical protein [Pseudomonadota bacterium]
PSGRRAVMSGAAAKTLGARTGDRLILRVSRRAGGQSQFGEVGLMVAGVLPPRPGGRPLIYIPFRLAEAVADYKDGFEVARLGWPGRARAAFPRFDGFALWFDQPPEPARMEALTTGTGVTRWRAVAPDRRADVIGFAASSEALVYLLLARRRPVDFDSYQLVRRRAGDMMIVPWVRPITVLVTAPAWPLPSLPRVTRAFGLSAARYFFKVHGLPFVPPWGPPRENARHSSLLRALAPAFGPGLTVNDRLEVTVLGLAGGPLTCPVKVVGVRSELKGLIVPSALMGLWRIARLRPVRFDPRGRRFLLARRAYAGFRLYARDPGDVPRLRRLLVRQGLTGLRSRAARLVRLRAALGRAVSHSPYRFFWQVTIGQGAMGDENRSGPAPAGPNGGFWSVILD